MQLGERRQADFPPCSYHAVLRAEAPELKDAVEFLKAARASAAALERGVRLFDPVPMRLVRWSWIKRSVTRSVAAEYARQDWMNPSRVARRESTIWQRRFWEHQIRDDADHAAHVDYVHVNPVKHGLVRAVADWPHSTFHRLVRKDVYPSDWAGADDLLPEYDFDG